MYFIPKQNQEFEEIGACLIEARVDPDRLLGFLYQ